MVNQFLMSTGDKGVPQSPESFSFKAPMGRTWLLYTVDVPQRVSRALGGEGKLTHSSACALPDGSSCGARGGSYHRAEMGGRITDQLRNLTREQSRLRPVEAREDSGAAGPRSRAFGPFGWVALLVGLALILGGWFVLRQLQASAKMQDCVMSGRKNCAPVSTDPARGAPSPE